MGFKKPTDTTVKSYVDKPGQYHVMVVHIEENPVHDNQVKDQVNFGIAVLGGTDPSQVRKELLIRLQNPNEGQKDGGEFCAKVQWRTAQALDIPAIITLEDGSRQYCKLQDVPDGAEIELDWLGQEHRDDPDNVSPWAIGRQMIVKLQEEEYQGKKSIKLSGAHVYHVTDPDVAEVPKDFKALELSGYKVNKPAAANAATAKPAASGATGTAKPDAKKPGGPGAVAGAAGAKNAAPVGNGGTKTPGGPGAAVGKAAPVAASNYDDL